MGNLPRKYARKADASDTTVGSQPCQEFRTGFSLLSARIFGLRETGRCHPQPRQLPRGREPLREGSLHAGVPPLVICQGGGTMLPAATLSVCTKPHCRSVRGSRPSQRTRRAGHPFCWRWRQDQKPHNLTDLRSNCYALPIRRGAFHHAARVSFTISSNISFRNVTTFPRSSGYTVMPHSKYREESRRKHSHKKLGA